MFYNRWGMFFFIAAYTAAALFIGVGLNGLRLWEPWNRTFFVFFGIWIFLCSSLPAALFRKTYSARLRRLGGVMLAFVLHLTPAFLFLSVWNLLSRVSALPAPGARGTGVVLNATLLWLAWGVARAQRIVVRPIEVEIPSASPGARIRIVAASDIHAGGVVEWRYLRRLRERIGNCAPDLILLPGDISDGGIASAMDAGLPDFLSSLSAPLGKYAVLGNHDIYAGAEDSIRLLEKAGFVVLRDETRIIGGLFVLAGRNDPRGKHFGIPRAPLASLLAGPGKTLPCVVADHTPENLNEAAECGAYLQISGHTHGGQVFPFNLIMKLKYGVSSGLRHAGETLICVSSGAGLWTMPLRTITRSEIVLCTLIFVPKKSVK